MSLTDLGGQNILNVPEKIINNKKNPAIKEIFVGFRYSSWLI
jgi:hypothetical protein